MADKGFYSAANVELLLHEKLYFILPLRRSNTLIDYGNITDNTYKAKASFFQHEKRPIWYQSKTISKKLTLFHFLDDQLQVKEETDYLIRTKTHPEEYSIEQYHKKRNRFGTIALLVNLDDNGESIYENYKSRMSIEILFDSMKNVLDSDHTYMQNEQTLHGWMFVNYLALQWYQHLYIELKDKNLLKKIWVNDCVQLLTDIKKIKINDQWVLNEITNQTQKLIQAVGVKI